ncbi:MAG: flagellar type III secretion system pore protein FliP [Oscillospiraceae bacterium]
MTETLNDKEQRKKQLKKQMIRLAISLLVCLALVFVCFSIASYAESTVSVNLGTGTEEGDFGPLELLFLLSLIGLAPSLLMMVTSFAMVIIVLSFLRNAMGTQASPPNQVIVGLALFLTLFIMMPVFSQINTVAYQPYKKGELTAQEAITAGTVPLKKFMLKQTNVSDLNLFLSLSGEKDKLTDKDMSTPDKLTQLSLTVVVPSFMTSEIKRAFEMGFLLYIPFVIIDLVVASTLMSMGMVMLPPTMIAMPFKLMIFVLVDGWTLLFEALIGSFVR